MIGCQCFPVGNKLEKSFPKIMTGDNTLLEIKSFLRTVHVTTLTGSKCSLDISVMWFARCFKSVPINFLRKNLFIWRETRDQRDYCPSCNILASRGDFPMKI